MDLKCRRQQKLHSVDENKLVGTIRVEGISPVVIYLAWEQAHYLCEFGENFGG